jgi:CBS domain containing-hemolysin-like protein
MITLQVGLILFLGALSVFLASVEASFNLLKRRRLSQVGFHDEKRVELAQHYIEDPPRIVMPVHLGTYTAHVGMTVIITSLIFHLVDQWAMLVAFGVMMAYLLLFRVSVPYILVRQDPEAAFLTLLPAFHLWAQALTPITSRIRRRAVPVPDEDEGAAVPEVPPPPVQQADEERLVDALGRFSETLVRTVMTPRPDVVAIASDASVADLRRLMRENKYSRVPVYGKDLDDILGVVEVRDLLDFEGPPESSVKELVRPVHLVPDTKRIPELLREMQGRHITFAVVVDEYGGTAGIVTVEDIVEELVGEIKDEYDVEGDPLAVDADGSVVADGKLGVDRLEEALETELSVDEEIDTVGGLVTSIFGQIPHAGERTLYRGFEVEVLAAERQRVKRVRFRRVPVSSPA